MRGAPHWVHKETQALLEGEIHKQGNKVSELEKKNKQLEEENKKLKRENKKLREKFGSGE